MLFFFSFRHVIKLDLLNEQREKQRGGYIERITHVSSRDDRKNVIRLLFSSPIFLFLHGI